MRIAVTGANGQLGGELCRRLGDDAIALSRPGCDLLRGDELVQTLCDLRPDAVINAAAYTAVDRAEREVELCLQINAEGVAHVAAACRQLDCPLVQLSTDYVFGADASRREPYRETDPTGPLSVYGRSKLEGEGHAAAWPKHFIVRTCGLYGKPNSTRQPTITALSIRGFTAISMLLLDDSWSRCPWRDLRASEGTESRLLVRPAAANCSARFQKTRSATSASCLHGFDHCRSPLWCRRFTKRIRRCGRTVFFEIRHDDVGSDSWASGVAKVLFKLALGVESRTP